MAGSGCEECGKCDWLRMNAEEWTFVGGEWETDADGLLAAPGDEVDENLALLTTRNYGDFEAEFEFRWESTFSTAAFILRAQDAQHYYVVDFPVVGQQNRA